MEETNSKPIPVAWLEDYNRFDAELPPQGKRIATEVLPVVIQRFLEKNRSYQLNSTNLAETLGARGQWADMYRKVMVCKPTMWDSGSSETPWTRAEAEAHVSEESVEERLEDLIGHALLALDMIKQGNLG